MTPQVPAPEVLAQMSQAERNELHRRLLAAEKGVAA